MQKGKLLAEIAIVNFFSQLFINELSSVAGISTTEISKKIPGDIEKILDQTREQLTSQEGLMFDGEPASPEAVDSILAALQVGMEMAKLKNKEKYTPKKYKKD